MTTLTSPLLLTLRPTKPAKLRQTNIPTPVLITFISPRSMGSILHIPTSRPRWVDAVACFRRRKIQRHRITSQATLVDGSVVLDAKSIGCLAKLRDLLLQLLDRVRGGRSAGVTLDPSWRKPSMSRSLERRNIHPSSACFPATGPTAVSSGRMACYPTRSRGHPLAVRHIPHLTLTQTCHLCRD